MGHEIKDPLHEGCNSFGFRDKCYKCFYFVDDKEISGLCHAKPPPFGEDFPVKWPRVHKYDWCGEFKPKDKDGTE